MTKSVTQARKEAAQARLAQRGKSLKKPARPKDDPPPVASKPRDVDEFGLNPRQRILADKFLELGEATAAYRAAGYKAKTDQAAYSGASEILSHPKVSAYVQMRRQEQAKNLDYGVQRVLQEVARIAFFDARRMFNKDGNLLPVHEMDDDTAAALASVEVRRQTLEGKQCGPDDKESQDVNIVETISKVKVNDKGAALDKLMRYHGLYKDRIEVSGFAQKLVTARERALAKRQQSGRRTT